MAAVYVTTSLEVAVHICARPLIGLNLYAIGTTSVIHFNLKTLLQCQAIAILLVSIGRPVAIMLYDWNTGILFSSTSSLLSSVNNFGVGLSGLVGYAIAVERCYATWRVKSYEQDKGKRFVLISLALIILPSLMVALNEGVLKGSSGSSRLQTISISSLIAIYASVAVGFLSFAVSNLLRTCLRL